MNAEVVRLVGIEERSYKGQDGKQRQYCGLHLVHLEESVSGVSGCKVEVLSCPRNVDSKRLVLGSLYQLEYEHYDTKNGKMARVVGLLLVEG